MGCSVQEWCKRNGIFSNKAVITKLHNTYWAAFGCQKTPRWSGCEWPLRDLFNDAAFAYNQQNLATITCAGTIGHNIWEDRDLMWPLLLFFAGIHRRYFADLRLQGVMLAISVKKTPSIRLRPEDKAAMWQANRWLVIDPLEFNVRWS